MSVCEMVKEVWYKRVWILFGIARAPAGACFDEGYEWNQKAAAEAAPGAFVIIFVRVKCEGQRGGLYGFGFYVK